MQMSSRATTAAKTMAAKTTAAKVRAYRQRQAAVGNKEHTFLLPCEAVAYLDAFKERQGLRNRSQALLQLIEQGREVAQAMS